MKTKHEAPAAHLANLAMIDDPENPTVDHPIHETESEVIEGDEVVQALEAEKLPELDLAGIYEVVCGALVIGGKRYKGRGEHKDGRVLVGAKVRMSNRDAILGLVEKTIEPADDATRALVEKHAGEIAAIHRRRHTYESPMANTNVMVG